MSNFVIAVGGSGAKLMQAMIHLGAAGMLPANRRELFAQLVDPDANNGNMEDCLALARNYRQCKELLSTGSSDLLSATISVDGPWTPLRDNGEDKLSEIFHYKQLIQDDAVDGDLLKLLFDSDELEMSIKQGFRGRPAIGATVFADAVHFEQEPWAGLSDKIEARAAQGNVRVLLAGSVFGGSGASGVPTLVRLLKEQFPDNDHVHLGLSLFLPFFQFRPVPGEILQADPAGFPMAAAEGLKYYDERDFLDFCDAIYAVGESVPTQLSVSAVGASEQRNEAHFLELVAGMGALRFFDDKLPAKGASLAVAGRNQDKTVAWDDLPFDEHRGAPLLKKLQQFATFAVAYRYIFYPKIDEALATGRSATPFWIDNIVRLNVDPEQAGRGLRELYEYTGRFLLWLLQVSTPNRTGFEPGLVNPHVFAERIGEQQWRLKHPSDFHVDDFVDLLRLPSVKNKLDGRTAERNTTAPVRDKNAAGAGRLVRALYDSCAA